MDNREFFARWDKWASEQLEKFNEKNGTDYRLRDDGGSVEICENGDVFVHTMGAYPAIYRAEVKPWKS